MKSLTFDAIQAEATEWWAGFAAAMEGKQCPYDAHESFENGYYSYTQGRT